MEKEEAREQLLSQIELELCRIHLSNSEAPQKFSEFYDYVSSLETDHFLINWYAINCGKVEIKFLDGEVRVIKTDSQEEPELHNETTIPYIHDDLIRQALDNRN